MKNPRFIMIGGFLGAGKTTTMGRLAAHYQALGNRVVIVTNDQATDLVDTLMLRNQGFEVGEVAGSCFCCNFNELTATMERLGESGRPDIVLAEPVGSCTDLVATVIRPLEQVYSIKFDISPYGVIVKPNHGLRILEGGQRAGFSPQAEYIFRKQIEEADFVIVNRVDELKAEQIDRLVELISCEYPGRPIVRMSAKTGQGFPELSEMVDSDLSAGNRNMEVDYDIYAIGEAELGWLNAQVSIDADSAWDLDSLLMDLIETLKQEFSKLDAETAHLKAIGMHEGYYAVANLTSSEDAPQLSLASGCRTQSANLVVNARVAVDPDTLTECVRSSIESIARLRKAKANITALQSFRPGRPVPTHRLNASN